MDIFFWRPLFNKGPSSHVWMWELDCEESRVLKNWCFWTVVLEKTLESPLYCKEIQPVHSNGDQSWVFFGKNAKAETPILWPPHAKSWLIGKDSDAGRDWGQEEGDDRGWDGWMASQLNGPVWVNSGSWWWTGRSGVLWFMGSQRVGHNWVTELNWILSRNILMDFFINWWDTLGLLNFRPSNKLLALYRETSELTGLIIYPWMSAGVLRIMNQAQDVDFYLGAFLMGPHTDCRKNYYMLFYKPFLQSFLCIHCAVCYA